jgi:sugar phosphate permease
MIAAEQQHGVVSSSTFVANVASISNIGGGIGQFVNGFVAQQLGGRQSSSLYLIGMGLCCFLLSILSSSDNKDVTILVGLLLAGLEFFASIQWTACSVILSNHYQERDPPSLAAGITLLSLSSTGGTLLSKTLGAALLQHQGISWRHLAQLGSLVTLVGVGLMQLFITEWPSSSETTTKRRWNIFPVGIQQRRQQQLPSLELQTIVHSTKAVLSSKLFWMMGVAHAAAFLARTSEKVLGSFFQQATNLPSKLYGIVVSAGMFMFILFFVF